MWLLLMALLAPPQPMVSLALLPDRCQAPCATTAEVMVAGYQPGSPLCLTVAPIGGASRSRTCWPWSGRKITDVAISSIAPGDYTILASVPRSSDAKHLHVSP